MNFYTLMSKLYDLLDVTYFRNKGKDPRAAINEIIRGENIAILDMCCGTLSNTIPIANSHKSANILGIDISRQMLQVARKKIAKNHLKNIRLKSLDATNTPLKNDVFDYVVIGLVLHETSPSLRRSILKEAYRVLKPSGYLIILEWEKPTSIFQKILYFPLLIGEQVLCKTFWEFYNCDKVQFFKENNFEVCEMHHCNYSTVFELKKTDNTQREINL